MRPSKIQFIFYCHSVDTIIFNFLCLLDPQPKAEKRHQTQLSDGVGCSFIFFAFHLQFCACPEKVGERAFIWCCESQ